MTNEEFETENLRLLNEVARLTAENTRLSRLATDRHYMMAAYHAMLMPKGLEVAAMWDKQGVKRQHTSWGDEAWELTGEERAQVHLDVEAAPKREVIDLDNGIYGEWK